VFGAVTVINVGSTVRAVALRASGTVGGARAGLMRIEITEANLLGPLTTSVSMPVTRLP